MTLSNYLQEKGAFTNDELKLISDSFSEVSFEKKSMLLEEGNICRYLFFITSGLVKT
jgi:CRP-like cAMP-binding protein